MKTLDEVRNDAIEAEIHTAECKIKQGINGKRPTFRDNDGLYITVKLIHGDTFDALKEAGYKYRHDGELTDIYVYPVGEGDN